MYIECAQRAVLYKSIRTDRITDTLSRCYTRAWITRRDHMGLGPRNSRMRGGEGNYLRTSHAHKHTDSQEL